MLKKTLKNVIFSTAEDVYGLSCFVLLYSVYHELIFCFDKYGFFCCCSGQDDEASLMRFLEQHSSDLEQHWPLPPRSALSALLPRKKGEHLSSMGIYYKLVSGLGYSSKGGHSLQTVNELHGGAKQLLPRG